MKKYETKVQELDVHRKEIIQMVKNGSSQKEIAEKLGWKINRVKYHVNRMRQQNIIKRVGTSHKGHWEVV